MNYERAAMPNPGDSILARQIRNLETQNGLYFSHSLQTGMVLEILNLFSGIFNVIS